MSSVTHIECMSTSERVRASPLIKYSGYVNTYIVFLIMIVLSNGKLRPSCKWFYYDFMFNAHNYSREVLVKEDIEPNLKVI